MIPNVTEGGGPHALLRYLLGPGRANEHEAPHLVAGDDLLLVWHGQEVLDRAEAGRIAAYLDGPRKAHGVEMRGRVYEADPATGDKRAVGERAVSVWHCSLSVPAGEGPLGDEKWRQVAQGFAERMGLTGNEDRAPVRWVAVHHGASKAGNDHIHLVASLVREDGTRWEGRWGSKKAAQAACRDLETRHGLVAVEGPARGVRERGVAPAEARRAVAAGLDPAISGPRELAARLRGAALASTSEAEFVRRARAEGIVIKPRYAPGSTDVVVGYKAALPPGPGSREWEFLGGGTLGRDLSLPRLRESWPAPDPETRAATVGEWQAAHAGTPAVVTGGREAVALHRDAPAAAAARLSGFNDRLTTLADTDRVGWADAARQAAGMTAAWARHDPAHATELTRAAGTLARSAQLSRPGAAPGDPVRESGMATALVLLRTGKAGAGGEVEELGREITRTATAVRDHHARTGHTAEATRIDTGVLARLQPALTAAAAAGRAARRLERLIEPEPDRGSEPETWWPSPPPDRDFGR